jgi:hypothetical protein
MGALIGIALAVVLGYAIYKGGIHIGSTTSIRVCRDRSDSCLFPSPTSMASPSGGPSTAPTDTTRSCSPRRSRLQHNAGYWPTSRPYGSTRAMTPRQRVNLLSSTASPIRSSPNNDAPASRRRRDPSGWGCGGQSSGPTHGCPTSVSSAGTPTGGVSIVSSNSRSPSCACSRPSSSTGGTDGQTICCLSAEPLRLNSE